MFAWFEKFFRLPPDPSPSESAAPLQIGLNGVYSVVAPGWRHSNHPAVFRGLNGNIVALVETFDQAITLRDTLNLACGDRPTRRLLDAIYREETVAPLASDRRAQP